MYRIQECLFIQMVLDIMAIYQHGRPQEEEVLEGEARLIVNRFSSR